MPIKSKNKHIMQLDKKHIPSFVDKLLSQSFFKEYIIRYYGVNTLDDVTNMLMSYKKQIDKQSDKQLDKQYA